MVEVIAMFGIPPVTALEHAFGVPITRVPTGEIAAETKRPSWIDHCLTSDHETLESAIDWRCSLADHAIVIVELPVNREQKIVKSNVWQPFGSMTLL